MTRKEVLDRLDAVFGKLKFEEETHTYTINGKKLSSVTADLKNFTTPFNAHMMAAVMAKKYNREHPSRPKKSAAWYKMYWKNKANEASSRGHRVHQYAEMFPYFSTPSCSQEQGVFDFFKILPKNYIVVASEYRVFSEKRGLAGTIDLLLYNSDTGKLVIADWKTNMTNVVMCYQNKKMKGPFKDLHEISYNKFAIQLSQYKTLIEESTEFEVEEHWIIWLREGDCFAIPEDKDESKYSIVMPEEEYTKEDNYVWFKMPMYHKELLEYFENPPAPKPARKKISKRSSASPLSASIKRSRRKKNGRK